MGIFATPAVTNPSSGLKILFLHGLEGSPSGVKARYLAEKWEAQSPAIRTQSLRALKDEMGAKPWKDISRNRIEKALIPAYSDACDAVRYYDPDVIVGSSLGGALLARMVTNNKWKGRCVFLAPAIKDILGDIELPQLKDSVWVLGEFDTIVSNGDNIKHILSCGGHLIISPNDSHRLHLALEKGLIDSAITTSLELSCHM